VWERTVDGRVLSFRLAGINNQNFIMADRETGTWWQQVTGIAIRGPLKGKRLTRVFHDELTFRAWTGERSGGRVLQPAADSAWIRNWRDEQQKTPTRLVRVAAPLDDRLPPRAIVVGIDLDGPSKAYPLDRVLAQAPLHDRLGGTSLVILVGEDGQSVRAFDARVDGAPIELVRLTDGSSVWADVGTASHWNFRGEAIEGPLKGKRLMPVYVLKDYWFDWKTYHPNTELYLLGQTAPKG
jgi:hypothetical protein